MPLLPAVPPKKLIPRVDFDLKHYRKMIASHGQRLTWEMAAECPCFTLATVQGRAGQGRERRNDCAACSGSGVIYHSSQEIRGIVTGAAANPDRFRLFGEYASGMISVGLLPEHLPALFDRFTMLDSVLAFRETRVREAVQEAPRYPIVTRSLSLDDGNGNGVATDVDVLYCRTANTDGTVGAELVRDTDFAVDSQGRIDWTLGDGLGTAPALGDRFAVSYFAHPVYVVREHPHAYRDTWVGTKLPTGPQHTAMPVNAACWLEFMGG